MPRRTIGDLLRVLLILPSTCSDLRPSLVVRIIPDRQSKLAKDNIRNAARCQAVRKADRCESGHGRLSVPRNRTERRAHMEFLAGAYGRACGRGQNRNLFQFPQSFLPRVTSKEHKYEKPLADSGDHGALLVVTVEPDYSITSMSLLNSSSSSGRSRIVRIPTYLEPASQPSLLSLRQSLEKPFAT